MTLPQLTSASVAFEFWSWPVVGSLGLAAFVALMFVDYRMKRRRDYWVWVWMFTAVVYAVAVTHALLTDVSQLWVLAGAICGTLIAIPLLRCKCCGAIARTGWFNMPAHCIQCGASRGMMGRSRSVYLGVERSQFLYSTIAEQVALDHQAQRRDAHLMRGASDRIRESIERWRRSRFARNVQRIETRDAHEKFANWLQRCTDRAVDSPQVSDEVGTSNSSPGTRFSRESTWSIVCEEFVDTGHSPQELSWLRAELLRRGFTATELAEMCSLACRTVGWTQFALHIWEWMHLDEHDVRRALDIQLAWGLIDADEYRRSSAFVREMLARRAAQTS